jgi:branched-chain amino acid transport system permease protein
MIALCQLTFAAVGAWIVSLLNVMQAPGGFIVWLVLGGIAAGLVGVLVGLPALRLRGVNLAVVTLGFAEIIRVFLQNFEPLGGALGLVGIPPYTTTFWVLAAASLTVFAVLSLVHSTYGRGFLATHDDEIAAESIGLNTTRYKVVAFTVGAFFAGIGGALFGHFKLTINPAGFDFMKSIEILVMVILGGMGNTLGVILAAIVLTILPEVLRPVAEYRMVVYSLLLVILMIVRPKGLFTLRAKKPAPTAT